jgi:hypothetical protein
VEVELLNAVSVGNLEKVKSILNNPGIDANQELKFENGQKGTLLLWAVQNGKFEMSKMLIHNYNADVNCNVDLDGNMTSILISAMTFCVER